MTDPTNPEGTQPPAYTPPPATEAPVYAQPPADQPQAYAAAPPPAPAYAQPAPSAPGKTLGIVGLILAIIAPLIGLILSIVAFVQSRKAGLKNGPALAGIIVGAILTVVGIIVTIAIIAGLGVAAAQLVEWCAQYGSGVHEINGVPVTLDCGN